MQFNRVKRREFITLLTGAAAWPLAARAQQPMPVIGLVAPASAGQVELIEALRLGLKQADFVEGQNVTIQSAFAEGQFDLLPVLAERLVRRQVAVITALDVAVTVAAKGATTTIPVVFYMGEDPVSLGLIASFNRPGGNITGVATLSSAVMAKRLQLLQEIAPRAHVFAVLINPKNPSATISAKEAQDAALTLGKNIHIAHASTESELESAFATIAQSGVGGLLIAPDGLFVAFATQVAKLALRYAIPASHERRAFPNAGGLMSYGASQADGIRLAGVYTGRILKGEKTADLPVQQSTKFELVINLSTAKALGLEVPDKLLALADEVIE